MATNKKVGTKLNDMSVERLIADFRACERLADDLATDPKTISDSRAKQNLRALENRMDVLEAELNRRGLDFDGKPLALGEQFIERGGRTFWECLVLSPKCERGTIAWFMYDCDSGAVSGDIAKTYTAAMCAVENWLEGQL